MITDIGKCVEYVKKLNPLYHIGRMLDRKEEASVWNGLEADGLDFVEQMESDSVGHSKYQITRPNHMKLVQSFLSQCNITAKDAILDIGCGKGGMLYVFHGFDFGKTDGIEYSAELCRIARSNMKRLDVVARIEQADAAEYENYDDYNYFYMYNPFGKDIMKNVISNIEKSRNRNPRDVVIMYSNPKHGDLFERVGYKSLTTLKTSMLFPEKVAIYFGQRVNCE